MFLPEPRKLLALYFHFYPKKMGDQSTQQMSQCVIPRELSADFFCRLMHQV